MRGAGAAYCYTCLALRGMCASLEHTYGSIVITRWRQFVPPCKKVKVAHTRLLSVGFLAVSLQVAPCNTWLFGPYIFIWLTGVPTTMHTQTTDRAT